MALTDLEARPAGSGGYLPPSGCPPSPTFPRCVRPAACALRDWMWMIDDKTLANRTAMSKFGVKFAQITIFFRKR